MEFSIRPYHPSDLPALCRICLLTGAGGEDASGLYRDPDLLGLYYVAPYVVLEPELCFVLLGDHQPCGYIVGTQDSAAFEARCEREWFPVLRQRYPLPDSSDAGPDAEIRRAIHSKGRAHEEFPLHPAHLHIDILPMAQGLGWGRKLMEAFLRKLRTSGAAGVHLGVDKTNRRAVQFYERLGFQVIRVLDDALIYGLRL